MMYGLHNMFKNQKLKWNQNMLKKWRQSVPVNQQLTIKQVSTQDLKKIKHIKKQLVKVKVAARMLN